MLLFFSTSISLDWLTLYDSFEDLFYIVACCHHCAQFMALETNYIILWVVLRTKNDSSHSLFISRFSVGLIRMNAAIVHRVWTNLKTLNPSTVIWALKGVSKQHKHQASRMRLLWSHPFRLVVFCYAHISTTLGWMTLRLLRMWKMWTLWLWSYLNYDLFRLASFHIL